MAVLPTVRRLWESDLVEKAINQIPNGLIDIIRVIAVADHETGAYKREDKVQVPSENKSETMEAEHREPDKTSRNWYY